MPSCNDEHFLPSFMNPCNCLDERKHQNFRGYSENDFENIIY
jgi:hypothetical protein